MSVRLCSIATVATVAATATSYQGDYLRLLCLYHYLRSLSLPTLLRTAAAGTTAVAPFATITVIAAPNTPRNPPRGPRSLQRVLGGTLGAEMQGVGPSGLIVEGAFRLAPPVIIACFGRDSLFGLLSRQFERAPGRM